MTLRQLSRGRDRMNKKNEAKKISKKINKAIKKLGLEEYFDNKEIEIVFDEKEQNNG